MWIKIEFKVQQNAMKKQVKHFNGSQHLEQKKVYGPWQYISMGDLNEEWKDQNEKQLIETCRPWWNFDYGLVDYMIRENAVQLQSN